MDGTEFLFPIGARVRLRDEVDPVFYNGLAKVGNEGWIRGHRREKRFGLPEVFIKWDPNHWAYNQQPDGWTFQEHFDPVQGSVVSDTDKSQAVKDLATQFANQMAAIFAGEPVEAPPADPQPTFPVATDEATQKYLEVAQKAADAIARSEAFMAVVITREPHPEADQGLLISNGYGDSLTPDAEALVGAQLSAAGAQFHRNAAYQNVQAFAEQRAAGETPDSGASGNA